MDSIPGRTLRCLSATEDLPFQVCLLLFRVLRILGVEWFRDWTRFGDFALSAVSPELSCVAVFVSALRLFLPSLVLVSLIRTV